MLKRWMLLPFLLLSLVLLPACGGAKDETAKPTKPTGNEQVLDITATNFEFNEKEYAVKAGQPVIISFASKQGVHAIQIGGTDISLDDGDSETVTLEAGEYNIICSIPCGSGHSKMVSKLIVS